ncbi:putative beta-glucosidase [Aureobasidium subglaciale]|nr:putative beta-glucosidase [Aureobasidium subglaciale]KAI5271389.1 putative beta-glucosidase [Aureobasidium subglaciale]
MVRLHAAGLTLAGLGLAQAQSNASLANAIYKDASQSVDARVENLVSLMTLEEKMAQLMQGDISNWLNTTSGEYNQTGLEFNFENRGGMFYVGYPITWDWLAEGIKVGQDYAVNNTRLGIPAIVQTEGIHGFLIGNATIFNSPIAQACSFNRDLQRQMGELIAIEAAALGVTQLFAPLADLARELRYGRVEETYGEDGYLAGEMAYNYIVGCQGQNVSAMVKHFAAYSDPEGGLNTAPVHGGERELRTTWLPPFHRAIIDGGAYSIMSAYHAYDGIPAVADYFMLTEILRNEWVQMGGGSFNFRSIPDLVGNKTIDISVVDEAVARVLRVKFQMGLFENPNPAAPKDQWHSIINNAAAKKLARDLDAESIVLLQNPNKTLPLSKSDKIAVIGPMASGFMNYGDYVVYQSQYRGVEYLEGIQNAVGPSANATVTYAKGCERWSTDESGIPEAVHAAENADVAVVIVGTWSRDQRELWQGLNATTGEHIDESDLGLVGAQRALVKAVIDTGKPTVVVFSSGKPLTEDWISNTTASLVQQFYPGEEGGNALADILFGKVNPSGKLSVSFPHDVGTLPAYYDFLNSGRATYPGYVGGDGNLYFGSSYILNTPVPWFPFGFGLSYTSFDYGNVTLSSSQVSATDSITATVSVTNNGTYDGAEVVQLYVKDLVASVTVPNIQLKGFEKVFIKAGETAEVSIPLAISDIGLWNRSMDYVVEPGNFTIFIGSSSADFRTNATLTVV